MDDDRLKQLFQDFQPALTPEADFIKKLERNLNAVELVRAQTVRLRRRYRVAMVAAAIVGFITGFIASYFVPYIGDALTNFSLSLPDSNAVRMIAANQLNIAWGFVATLSIIMAVTTFDLTQSLSSISRK